MTVPVAYEPGALAAELERAQSAHWAAMVQSLTAVGRSAVPEPRGAVLLAKTLVGLRAVQALAHSGPVGASAAEEAGPGSLSIDSPGQGWPETALMDSRAAVGLHYRLV